MPRRCTVCTHDLRDEVDRALVAGEPFRSIAARFGLSKTALIRHKRSHIPACLTLAHEAAEVCRADDLLGQVAALRDRAINILDCAESAGELDVALRAIRETRSCLEVLARLLGELRDSPTINVLFMPEWLEVQAVVVGALEQHPEARRAVVDALGRLGAGRR